MLEMDSVGSKETGEWRDMRKEIEESIANHVDDEVGLRCMPFARGWILGRGERWVLVIFIQN